MKIKNTKELRLRANSHARNDHILQRTYGDGSINGHAEYQGCAIGCLSTPHRKNDLVSFLKAKINEWGRWYANGYEQRDRLATEFGISQRLSVVIETLFEGQPTHGAAINFVRDFAAACPEGADIQDRHVVAFLRREGIPRGMAGRSTYLTLAEKIGKERMEDFTTSFLDWLKSRG